MINTSQYVDTLHNLSESMGDKITLNQALKIADRIEEETQKIIDRGYPDEGYDMSKEYDDILTEVLGKKLSQ